jgi:SH3-like domain-containing protein
MDQDLVEETCKRWIRERSDRWCKLDQKAVEGAMDQGAFKGAMDQDLVEGAIDGTSVLVREY